MRYISADYIFPISSDPIKYGIVVIDENGVIFELLDLNSPIPDDAVLEKYPGVICPGFINAHCHLELSHMKGIIPEKTGMAGFVKEMISARPKFSKEQIAAGIIEAEKEMIHNGIVAVGDISNNDSTFELKKKGNLKYHTFLETFDINPDKAEDVFNNALQLKTGNPELETSIVPHAPYSVSERLFKLIRDHAINNNSVISCHNQESQAENELFENKSGSIAELFRSMGSDLAHITQMKKNSLKSTLPFFSDKNKTVLVHNTFTSEDDIEFSEIYFQIPNPKSQTPNLFWCFCPNANLYIENKLPDYQLFIDTNVQCVVGTDSLASNHQLNILEELKIISKNSPEIQLETLLTWATLNGAELLGFENELGSIEQGKKPGLVLIDNIDLEKMQLTSKSSSKRII